MLKLNCYCKKSPCKLSCYRFTIFQAIKDEVDLKSAELDRVVSSEQDRYLAATEQTALPSDLENKVTEVKHLRDQLKDTIKQQVNR